VILRNFYDDKLAQASYLVGCAATGEAIVIDPLRDIRQYLDTAEALGLRITAVTETHIHADFLSGSRELARATGALLFLSDEGDELWKCAFAGEPHIRLMKDGHVIRIGNLSLTALHTPGHTPEHLSFLLVDHPMGETPHSLFTGDFVFVGDVGRPDLLERAANFAGTMEKGARTLFRSLQRLADLPDSLLLWPAHGAGSACGKSLGGSPVTSLGYERATNWAFRIQNEDKFVEEVLAGQPEPPKYFKEMKRLNKEGPTLLGSLPRVARIAEPVGTLLDVREEEMIRTDLVEGSLAIPRSRSFPTWAGWLLDYETPVTFVADSQEQADRAARDMATVGLDAVAGWLPSSALEGRPRVDVVEVEATDLPGDAFILDVRGLNEHSVSNIPSATHISLGSLPDRLDELPRDRTIHIFCASGFRTIIADSVLRRAGFRDVAEIRGGLARIARTRPELLASGRPS